MAATQIDTVSTGADKAKAALVVALVVASIAGFYVFSKHGAVVQWAILLVGLVAAVGVFLTSEWGRQFVGFARDAGKEVKKSSLANAQRNNANDGLRFCIRSVDGAVSLAYG